MEGGRRRRREEEGNAGERKEKKELYAMIWNGEVFLLFTAHGSNK